MSTEQRIRGEEVQIRLTRNKVLERTLTAIKSFTFTAKFAILTEGYLGKTTNDRDEIFQGCSFQLEFHSTSRDSWELLNFVKTRATRRGGQSLFVVNASFTGTFPDGSRPRITTPDLKFGDMPISVPGREQYVSQTLTCECEDFQYSPQ